MDLKALSVTELTRQIKGRLESDYKEVWVEGEVTNYRGPASSGHRYFSLKDENSQLKAVLFKQAASRGLGFELTEGQQVLAYGRVTVYEPRGEYQLVAERLEPRGVGALQLAFEQLKRKLEAQGLFEQSRKRPLPPFPEKIVVITAPGGAVIQDILNITARRCPWIDILVIPVRVQGEGAALEISGALRYASTHLEGDVDLILLARGGGSLEDLWAFNEESVARAIFDSSLPVISAVGHEVDFSIADFVADFRAPTPSAAAELISASKEELQSRLNQSRERLSQGLKVWMRDRSGSLESLLERLARCDPRAMLEGHIQRLDDLGGRLFQGLNRLLKLKRESLASKAAHLQALSPLSILGRGYAACFDSQGRLLRSAAETRAGDEVEIRLGQGAINATVKATRG
jgi:exodeoxyribonuclease VII large subunit